MTITKNRILTDTGKPIDVTKKCECDADKITPTFMLSHNLQDMYIDENCGKRLSSEDKLNYDLQNGYNGFDEDNRGDNYLEILEDCNDV